MSMNPPGWYPDGSATGVVRYWDGVNWTPHTAQQPSYASPPYPTYGTFPATTRSAPTVGWFGIAAAGVGLIGSFLPWVSVLSIFGTLEVTGFDAGDGKLTAIAGAIAVLFGILGVVNRSRAMIITAAITSLLGLAVAVYDFGDVTNHISSVDSEAVRASVGYGLYGCVGGFTVCTICLFVALKDVNH